MGVLAFVGWFVVRHKNAHEDAVRVSRALEHTIALHRLLRDHTQRQVALLDHFVDTNDPKLRESFDGLNDGLADAKIGYMALDLDVEERVVVEHIRREHSQLQLRASRVFEFVTSGELDKVAGTMSEVEELEQSIDRGFEQLNSIQVKRVRELHQIADAGPGIGLLTFGVLYVTALLTAFFVLFRRRVLSPLGRLLAAQDQVQHGELTARAVVRRPDEFGRAADGFNQMAASLADSYADLESRVEERTRELEQVQGRLIQSEKMSAVGQLVSGVAHELNNPLTSVMGFAAMTRERLAESGADEELVHNLAMIVRESERCAKIVANLLQFVRKQEAKQEPIRLDAVVRDAVDLRSYELKSRDIRIETNLDVDRPVVLGETQKLQQVVLNLLNNAVDAIRERGESGTIQVDLSEADGQMHLRVRDDGPGFVDERRAFDPFYTTKAEGKGTGLGLSVCYGIVREHHGRIHAGNWDRGAEVVVSLPRSGEPLAKGSHGGDPGRNEAKYRMSGKVLVVDDEVALVELQKKMLATAGLEAHGVVSGDQAVDYLEKQSVDLVISDVRMPGKVDGVALYRWVCEHRPALASSFLLATGDAAGLDEQLPPELVEVCLHKPFSRDAYLHAVRRALSTSRVGS